MFGTLTEDMLPRDDKVRLLLREVTDQAIQRPQFLRTAQTGGFDVPRLSTEEMAKFLRDDAIRWREVTKFANIVVE